MEQLKKGDFVVCLPGFDKSDTGDFKGGSGYEVGKILEIDHFSSNNTIFWPKNSHQSLYNQCVRFATQQEISSYHAGIRNTSGIKYNEIINNYNFY